jgi:hypothetical protein
MDGEPGGRAGALAIDGGALPFGAGLLALQDELVVLEEALRELLAVMHESRVRRLRSAGFDADRAQVLSNLHPPNFM